MHGSRFLIDPLQIKPQEEQRKLKKNHHPQYLLNYKLPPSQSAYLPQSFVKLAKVKPNLAGSEDCAASDKDAKEHESLKSRQSCERVKQQDVKVETEPSQIVPYILKDRESSQEKPEIQKRGHI